MVLNGMAILSMVIIVLRMLISVHRYNYKVATGYTQYGVDSFIKGEWYSLYEPAIFAVITTVAAILISARIYKIDKSLAYTTIALHNIVLLFLIIFLGALLGVSAIAT